MSFFPYLTYAIPAVAGLFIMITVIETDCKWALTSYLVSAFLVFLWADPESKLMYIFFFGFYPVIKALLERMHKPLIEWAIKTVVFNVSVLTVYFIFAPLIGIPVDDFGILGKYGAVILLVAGNGVFVLYDIAVSRMAMMYMYLLHPRVKRIFKS